MTNTDPEINSEVMNLLRVAYKIVSDEEEKDIKKQIEREEYLKITYSEILKEKKIFGFKSIDEHIELMKQEKKRFRERFKNFIIKKESELLKVSIKRWKIISFSSTVAATITIFFVIFQLSDPDSSYDEYVTKVQYDSLEQRLNTLLPIIGENKTLLAEISQKKSEIVTTKQLLEVQNEKMQILESKPSAINELALYKQLAEKKGYEDKYGLFSLPDTVGVYAGGEETLHVVLMSPANLDAFFVDDLLDFSWNSDLIGLAKLNCYVAKTMDIAFKKDIILGNKKIAVSVSNLQPGVYLWLIENEGIFSKRKYFTLLP